MSDITPEKVAAAACEDVGGWVESLQAALSVTAQGNVLSLDVVRWDGPDGAETVRHHRAVVLPGETVPVVLPRPSFVDQRELEGKPYNAGSEEDGWQVCAAYPNGRPTQVVFGDSIVFRGSGHISTDEARRMAAALAAMADAVDAAQAEQDGGRADG
jgi:hypothetical protein